MFKRIIAVLLIAILFGFAMPAVAQAPPEEQRLEKITEYRFHEDEITGKLKSPDQTRIDGEQARKTDNLIKTRRDFIAEMIKSTEDL